VLGWDKSAEALPEFVKKVNQGNAFNIDKNFVIRSLFAVSHLGTKFNIDVLRKKSNVEKIKNNFNQCCKAIESTLDFIIKHCGISNSRALGGYNNFIPIVYYLFYTPKHIVPTDQTSKLRKLLFLLGFTKPFSRYADSRLWKYIREELKPLLENNEYEIPFKNSIEWIMYWENVDGFNDNLLNRNHLLVHYLVQGLSSDIALYDKNNPQMDHIFPRSILREKEYNDIEINHYANFWILEQEKNQNKSNKHPKNFFKDIKDKELKRLFIDRNLFNYGRYRTFIKTRAEKIKTFIKDKTEINDKDFEIAEEE